MRASEMQEQLAGLAAHLEEKINAQQKLIERHRETKKFYEDQIYNAEILVQELQAIQGKLAGIVEQGTKALLEPCSEYRRLEQSGFKPLDAGGLAESASGSVKGGFMGASPLIPRIQPE
jgi:DNA repair exonuclease SbcCD ATPase subunit